MCVFREYLVLGCVLGLVGILGPIAALAQAGGRLASDADLFLAIGTPRAGLEDVALAHGGYAVGRQHSRWVTLITGSAQTRAALLRNGAWFVVPAEALRGLCAPNSGVL